MNIILEKFSIHSMSVEESSPVKRIIDGEIEDNDVGNYIIHIIKETTTPPKNQQQIKGQYFNFERMNEVVAANSKKIVLDIENQAWEELTLDNAKKLLDVEKKTQADIAKMNQKIRTGCLLQIKCKLNEKTTLFLVKIDDNAYLDSEIMKLKTGLPLNTRMQKVAIIKFNDDADVESLLLSDTNATISKYWKTDYLVAIPLRDEQTNTSNAFNAIDKLLKNSIRKISKKDFYFIRNQVIIDFRKESFDFNDLVENLKKYIPVNETLDQKIYGKFIKDLEALPISEKNAFDTQFDIETKVIKAKLNNKIMIDDNFELLIKGDVTDLRDKLGTGIDAETNQKFVKIYSDSGYDMLENSKPQK